MVLSAARRRWWLAALLGGALAWLTAAVVWSWWPVAIDTGVRAALPGERAGLPVSLLRAAAQVVVDVATPEVAVVLTLLLAGALTRSSGALRAAARLFPALAFLSAAVIGGKAAIARPGPGQTELLHGLGYYPSGHTTTAVVCSGLVVWQLVRCRPQWRRALVVAAVAWSVVVAASMVALDYHWLTDVVAGWLLGGLVLVVAAPSAPVGEKAMHSKGFSLRGRR